LTEKVWNSFSFQYDSRQTSLAGAFIGMSETAPTKRLAIITLAAAAPLAAFA